MSVSSYSAFMALLWFTFSAFIACAILRRAEKHGLAFIFLLAILRGILPLEYYGSIIIRLGKIYPALVDVLSAQIYGGITVRWFLLTLWGVGTVVQLVRFLWGLVRQTRFLHNASCELPGGEAVLLLNEVCGYSPTAVLQRAGKFFYGKLLFALPVIHGAIPHKRDATRA